MRERYHKTSDEQKATQIEVKKHALEDEAARDEKLAEGPIHEHRHHWLAAAATLAEIGIAICTVAIITRRKLFWRRITHPHRPVTSSPPALDLDHWRRNSSPQEAASRLRAPCMACVGHA